MPDYCTLDFNHSLYSKLLTEIPKVETRTDFSTTFTTTNTGTLYKATESIAGLLQKMYTTLQEMQKTTGLSLQVFTGE